MVSRTARVVACALFLVAFAGPARADAILDFEGFGSQEELTTQLGGFIFSNAMVLTAGESLNEIDFPPHSGANVIFDFGGAMRIDFTAPQDVFSGYFNYVAPLILSAFDAGGNLLGSVTSALAFNLFDPTLGAGGNELLTLAFANMAYVTIAGAATGGSFTLDDVSTVSAANVEPVPEPGTLALVGIGSLAMIRALRARRSRRT